MASNQTKKTAKADTIEMIKRIMSMVSLKQLCKGVEHEIKTYMNYFQVIVLFFSKDLN
jgi:hypothetical protein